MNAAPSPVPQHAAATVAALQAALAAEHAAIYGYGVAGSRLSGERQERAQRAWEAHRARRDRLRAVIARRGAEPVAAQPAYRLPFPVTTARAAVQLAATLEDGVTAAYLGLVGVPSLRLRRYAALAMQESVARATQWRGATTAAFPGLPRQAVQPPRPTDTTG